MQIADLWTDMGKNSCSIVALDMAGRVALHRLLHRDGVVKLGNACLRKMLIHGARTALPPLSKAEAPLGQWLRALLV